MTPCGNCAAEPPRHHKCVQNTSSNVNEGSEEGGRQAGECLGQKGTQTREPSCIACALLIVSARGGYDCSCFAQGILRLLLSPFFSPSIRINLSIIYLSISFGVGRVVLISYGPEAGNSPPLLTLSTKTNALLRAQKKPPEWHVKSFLSDMLL